MVQQPAREQDRPLALGKAAGQPDLTLPRPQDEHSGDESRVQVFEAQRNMKLSFSCTSAFRSFSFVLAATALLS